METLRNYLNSLSRLEQAAFAERCGTSIGYLRKAISKHQRFDAGLAVNIERESDSAVLCEELRPDIDWGVLRCPEGRPTNAVAA